MSEMVRTQIYLRPDQHEYIYTVTQSPDPKQRSSMAEWIRQAVDEKMKREKEPRYQWQDGI